MLSGECQEKEVTMKTTKLRSTAIPAFFLPVLVLTLQASPAGACGKKGYWVCTRTWDAGTSFRSMSGTEIECGGFHCGDVSHSQPNTWIDIVGGLSQSCEDTSTSFYGPINGQWNGCSSFYQESTGYRQITGINQKASFWPFPGGVRDVWDDGFCYDPFEDPPSPPYVWYSGPATFNVTGAFASVYDLDTCTPKQLMGTIYWPSFTVTSEIVQDQPTYKIAHVSGGAGVACSAPVSSCENDSLCADLVVRSVQQCSWSWHEPWTRCDLDCQ